MVKAVVTTVQSKQTKAVFFTPKKNLNPPQLIFQQCSLEYVPTHKHLGSTQSNKLGWSVHINTIV